MPTQIPESIIESIKTNTSFLSLLNSYGITPIKRGKSCFATCPFHDSNGHAEKEPSLSIDPARNLYHCFSCDARGNVIQFVQAFEKTTFQGAVKKLLAIKPNNSGTHKQRKEKNIQKKLEITPEERQVLLQEIITRSTENLRNSKPGREYLESRGLDPLYLMKYYDMGYIESSLYKNLVPTEKSKLTALGMYNGTKVLFDGCVIFPLKKDNRISTIYGRNTRGIGGHYLLPCPREGLFLPKTGLNPQKPVILTESIIDALSLFAAGSTNVLPLLGTNGFLDDHLTYLKQQYFPRIYIALNGDIPGNRAAAQLKINLEKEGFSSEIIALPPDKDINDMLQEFGVSSLKQWFAEHSTQDADPKPTVWEDDEDMYILFSDREYRIRGLTPIGMDRLRVNIKVYRLNHKDRFFIDTVDLYQSRVREHFIVQTAKLFALDQETIKDDVHTMITILEEHRVSRKNDTKNSTYTLSTEEYKEAEAYLQAPDLLNRIARDFESCGMVGNRNVCILAYLGALSRLTEKPFGILIVSRSGAGKSFLQDLIASFTPEEQLLSMTRLTGQSLFYQGKEGLKHKLLTIEEDEGMQEAMYSIRTLLSSQKLCLHGLKTDQKSGSFTSYENIVEGPASVMISTTDLSSFDHESVNRFFVLFLDESTKQTQAILDHQIKMAGSEKIRLKLARQKISRLHRNIQRIIKPLTVVNNIGTGISYPTEILHTRREQTKTESLIEVVALLHQYQREINTKKFFGTGVNYIEVTKKDIELVHNIAGDILSQSLDELSKLCRDLLMYIHELVNEKYTQERLKHPNLEYWHVRFTRKELLERSGWSRWHVEEHLNELVKAGYITQKMGRKGQRYAYSLVDDTIPKVPDLKRSI